MAEQQLGVSEALHDYQWQGIAFLYRSEAALLADEMGLGKTVQAAVALALLLNARNNINRALIVAPASLTLNWMTEFATWTPGVTVRRLQGNVADRQAFYLLPIPVLVGSYEQVRQDGLDRIPAGTFDIVVLDEAQRIKNRNSATALACRLLPRKRAWALSATPLENNRDDVESVLAFLESRAGNDLPPSQLTDRLSQQMLRRRKAEVRSQLPPVIVQDLRLDLAPPQRARYDELWVDRQNAVGTNAPGELGAVLLGLITRLKIICNFDDSANASSKLEALLEICESAGESARILVFSQFVETLNWISERLTLPCDFLTGSMSVEKRQIAMENFREGPAPRVLLVSLRAGGVGLNLGEASHVVLIDRWWNPAVEMQAIYRAHRFDRDQPLHVIRLLVVDSIEERIAEILARKERLFEDVIDSTDTQVHDLTVQELMQILEISSPDVHHVSPLTEGD